MDFISNYWLAIVLRLPLGVIACILAKKSTELHGYGL